MEERKCGKCFGWRKEKMHKSWKSYPGSVLYFIFHCVAVISFFFEHVCKCNGMDSLHKDEIFLKIHVLSVLL